MLPRGRPRTTIFAHPEVGGVNEPGLEGIQHSSCLGIPDQMKGHSALQPGHGQVKGEALCHVGIGQAVPLVTVLEVDPGNPQAPRKSRIQVKGMGIKLGKPHILSQAEACQKRG